MCLQMTVALHRLTSFTHRTSGLSAEWKKYRVCKILRKQTAELQLDPLWGANPYKMESGSKIHLHHYVPLSIVDRQKGGQLKSFIEYMGN